MTVKIFKKSKNLENLKKSSIARCYCTFNAVVYGERQHSNQQRQRNTCKEEYNNKNMLCLNFFCTCKEVLPMPLIRSWTRFSNFNCYFFVGMVHISLSTQTQNMFFGTKYLRLENQSLKYRDNHSYELLLTLSRMN